MNPNQVLHRALALALLLSLSGCLQPPDERGSQGFRGQLVLPLQCVHDSSWAPCLNSTATEYVVEGLILSRDESSSAWGIWVDFLDKNLTLRNVTMNGFDSGIVLWRTQCTACTLRLENVTLIGTSSKKTDKSHPWNEPTGLLAMQEQPYGIPNLVVDGLRIEGFQSAIVWLTNEADDPVSGQLQNTTINCLHEGVRLGVAHAQIEDAAVDACQGVGLRVQGYAEATIQRMEFTRNWQGVIAFGAAADSLIRVTDSVFEANEVGGLANRQGSATLTNNAFRNNGAAPRGTTYGDLEVKVLHATLTSGLSFQTDDAAFTLRGNCIQGNVGWGAVDAGLTRMNLADNWWGSSTGPREGKTVERDFERPQPLVPAGTGDLVPAGTVVGTFLQVPPASCGLLERH